MTAVCPFGASPRGRNLSPEVVLKLPLTVVRVRKLVGSWQEARQEGKGKERTAMKNLISVLVTAWVFDLAFVLAQVPPPPPNPPVGRGNPANTIQQVLDLTERQLSELNVLREEHNKKVQELSAQLRQLEQRRREQMQSASPNAAEIGSLALQIQGIQKQIQEENAAYRENALRVLDSGQREKVEQIEEALKLAPQAGALAAYGLLDLQAIGRGFVPGMAAGAIMRGMMGPGAPPPPPPPQGP